MDTQNYMKTNSTNFPRRTNTNRSVVGPPVDAGPLVGAYGVQGGGGGGEEEEGADEAGLVLQKVVGGVKEEEEEVGGEERGVEGAYAQHHRRQGAHQAPHGLGRLACPNIGG